MVLGSTQEGFEYRLGDAVWVAKLVTVPQPTLRQLTPTKENPQAFTDNQLPERNIYKPQQLTATERLVDKCWKRYGDCSVHCDVLNRALQ